MFLSQRSQNAYRSTKHFNLALQLNLYLNKIYKMLSSRLYCCAYLLQFLQSGRRVRVQGDPLAGNVDSAIWTQIGSLDACLLQSCLTSLCFYQVASAGPEE